VEVLSEQRCFGGVQGVYRHRSEATGTDMELSVYLPPAAETGRVPALFYLSGLTCTWENFTVKAGAQRYAAEHGIALVAPDTSPRGTDLPGEHDSHDFGSGAGFYLDAIREPWSAHYRMESYVAEELPRLLAGRFALDPERLGLCGHSMGGHGALVLALRGGSDRWRSLSALAPISSPTRCPWGQKAFRGYLGEDPEAWRAYDACELVADSGWRRPVLVDQGDADGFLEEQLRPELLRAAFEAAGVPLELRMQAGYDHSYYFVATFVGDHVAHHARCLAR